MSSILAFVKNQPVRFFALVCVAITSAYVMWMGWRLVETLSSPGWCNRALKADEIAPSGTFDALEACVGLLSIQLKSLATNSHIYAGVIALCLLALMVIVVAGGHLSVGSKLGNVNIGSGPVEEAKAQGAVETADAAVAKAAEIAGEAPEEPPWR
jgi:hypothetical protein